MSSSGSQVSMRPPAKPKVSKPIDSRATLPARIIRSAQEIFRPYFCLIGHSSRRALSRLALSGQLPRHANEQPAVMPKIGRPPILRIRHQGIQVLDHGRQVEAVEFLGVVE